MPATVIVVVPDFDELSFALTRPINLPSALKSPPPELPGFIAASV